MLTAEVAAVLEEVNRPGTFCVSGCTRIFAPLLEVEGVGRIALPLLSVQAEQLTAVAEPAPYGRGELTLVDPSVRRTWQIPADRVRLEGKGWARRFEKLLARVATGLGVTDPVRAELYKLLIYDEGSFFVSHRDTEKVPGMFATLVVVLPSVYAGGELLVRHKGCEVRLDLHCGDPSEAAYAAFYADCRHEVFPVTEGCRLTLVYNLIRQGEVPRPPDHTPQEERLKSLLQGWVRNIESGDAPEKLVYLLEHAYTPAELAFSALKGADSARSAVLRTAAEQAGCDLSLALLTVSESGIAEHAYYGRRRWTREDPDEFEIVEVSERSVTLSEWRRPDGGSPVLGELPVEDEEVSPPDVLQALEPDDVSFQEATGNEGASFDRTYRQAAAVLWPRSRRLAVVNQGGRGMTVPMLEALAGRWETAGEPVRSPLWNEAHELSDFMLRAWVDQHDHYGSERSAPRVLEALCRLHDEDRLATFLSDISAEGRYETKDNPSVLRALALLPQRKASDLLKRIVAGNVAAKPAACADLLARAALASGDSPFNLGPSAKVLVDALPGDPSALRATPSRMPAPADPSFVVDLLTALGFIDEKLADGAATTLLERPGTFRLDDVLVPALRELRSRAATWSLGATQRVLAACVEHLRGRIAQPLQPPTDLARDSKLVCRCSECRELGRFLANPVERVWVYKAAEPGRSHIEDTVRRSGPDLDLTTDRRGRPYSLVATKNQASYEKRMQQRRKDLENLAALVPQGG